jgi:hypothetical protein
MRNARLLSAAAVLLVGCGCIASCSSSSDSNPGQPSAGSSGTAGQAGSGQGGAGGSVGNSSDAGGAAGLGGQPSGGSSGAVSCPNHWDCPGNYYTFAGGLFCRGDELYSGAFSCAAGCPCECYATLYQHCDTGCSPTDGGAQCGQVDAATGGDAGLDGDAQSGGDSQSDAQG